MDAWIILSNYESFALVYGCSTLSGEGTCHNHHGWVWSRSRDLSDEDKEVISGKLPDLCLEWDDWLYMPHDQRMYTFNK